MQLGYTILYVADVAATLDFYERAFGLARRFLHESGEYGELETGSTVLAFASEPMAELNGIAVRPHRSSETAAAFELAFVTDTPETAYAAAVAAGAVAVAPVSQRPWGQKVGHLRDLNGVLVEICSPVG